MIGSASVRDERASVLMAIGLTVLATVILYWPALGVGFLGDDFMILHRLRGLAQPGDMMRFFRGEFFEYYRPLGFVSHAIDWAIAGQSARQFHFTNIAIHVINTILVLLIARSLSPRPLAAVLAAALFALHASNNEAVVWISARFDLLATCFALAAVYCMMRGGVATRAAAVIFFFCALLSKESAVALPIAAAGWSTFRCRATSARSIIFVAPWLAALAVYSGLRHLAGGVSAVGGASRIPKLAAFIICVTALVALGSGRWVRLRDWLRPRRARCVGIILALLVGAVLIAAQSAGGTGALAREKLSVAGFATYYLISPVLRAGEAVYSDPTTARAWALGAVAILAGASILFICWRTLLDDDRYWLLAALFLATMLPISALTEGKRYLYLPSAVASIVIAILVVEMRGRARRFALSAITVLVALSAVQIAMRVQDWRWAGQMTSEGAQLVDSALAPSCGTGHVVFLTSPVGMRGVYSHFYYETFEVPRGCMPEVFQVVVRVGRVDTPIEVRWQATDEILVTARPYRENFLLSRDLRTFDVPLRDGQSINMQTPLGHVQANAANGESRITLRLSPDARLQPIHFFYYSDGRIHAFGQPQ